MEERDFFLEARAPRGATLQCPFCRTASQYNLTWLFRKKRTNIDLARLDERDRARFEKAASYMVLLDDAVTCANTNCRRRFEVSGVKTMAFVTPEQLEEVEFGREGRDAGRASQDRFRGGQDRSRAGQQQPQGYGAPRGQGSPRNTSQPAARQGRGKESRRDADDNFGNCIDDDRQPSSRGGYGQPYQGVYAPSGYGQQGYGQQGSGQQRFGKNKPSQGGGPGGRKGGPGGRQAGPGDRQGTQPPRQDDAQPLRSPRGKRPDPTGPGGGWR